MKNIKSVIYVSVSTITSVILSAVGLAAFMILLMASAGLANEIGDEFGGPGINMEDSTWNGTATNRIYQYGNTNNIVGNEIVAGKALSTDGPTKYIEYTEDNPIDKAALDNGPTSSNNSAYSLHFIDDNGPGKNVMSNELGTTKYYNIGPSNS